MTPPIFRTTTTFLFLEWNTLHVFSINSFSLLLNKKSFFSTLSFPSPLFLPIVNTAKSEFSAMAFKSLSV